MHDHKHENSSVSFDLIENNRINEFYCDSYSILWAAQEQYFDYSHHIFLTSKEFCFIPNKISEEFPKFCAGNVQFSIIRFKTNSRFNLIQSLILFSLGSSSVSRRAFVNSRNHSFSTHRFALTEKQINFTSHIVFLHLSVFTSVRQKVVSPFSVCFKQSRSVFSCTACTACSKRENYIILFSFFSPNFLFFRINRKYTSHKNLKSIDETKLKSVKWCAVAFDQVSVLYRLLQWNMCCSVIRIWAYSRSSCAFFVVLFGNSFSLAVVSLTIVYQASQFISLPTASTYHCDDNKM